jgi:hypothetical protein
VNLTANMHDGRGGRCYEVGVVEQSAVPGENDQAFQRPHRIGCTRQVRVRLFELDDPVDRRWTQLVSGKSLHIAATMRETRLLSKEFTYFKRSGKFYCSGELETDMAFYELIRAVKDGLVLCPGITAPIWRDGPILIEYKGVPHIILDFVGTEA